jgi:hypothetical protein
MGTLTQLETRTAARKAFEASTATAAAVDILGDVEETGFKNKRKGRI